MTGMPVTWTLCVIFPSLKTIVPVEGAVLIVSLTSVFVEVMVVGLFSVMAPAGDDSTVMELTVAFNAPDGSSYRTVVAV